MVFVHSAALEAIYAPCSRTPKLFHPEPATLSVQAPLLRPSHRTLLILQRFLSLVEWVGPGTPVGEEQAEANGLEDTADNTNGNEVKRSLLADDLSNELG